MPKSFVPLLTPLRGEPKLSPIVGFDTETFGEDNVFQMGVVSTPEADVTFDDSTKMLDFMCRREFWTYKIFATNLAFDAFALFQASKAPGEMPQGWSFFDNGSKLIFVRKIVSEEVRQTTGARKLKYQTLQDSLNIFPGGVEAMGKILSQVSQNYRDSGDYELADYYQEAKLISPSWLGKRQWVNLSDDNREKLITYCAADARVTRKFMEWFSRQIHELGAEMRITAASTALDLFRRKYLKESNTVIPQPSWDCLVDSKLSYYGGRTEAFRVGSCEEVYEADFTAMYPSSMVEIEFPYPSPENFRKVTDPPHTILNFEGFSKVAIKVPYMEIPPLPFRTPDKLLFPYGLLKGVWTNLELRYAIKLGCQIKEIEWTYFNDQTFNPFKGYVTDLFDKRLEYLCPIKCAKFEVGLKCQHRLATEEVVKLFLNSLYGKFGQNFLTQEQADLLEIGIKPPGGTYKSFDDASPAEIAFTGSTYPHLLAKGFVLEKATPKLKAFMNPILSSYVTAAGRIKLHEAIIRARSEGALVLYTDTDSLYYQKASGPLSFVTNQKKLGTLQAGKLYSQMVVVGPKAKLLLEKDGTKTATWKGVPRKSFTTDYSKLTPSMTDKQIDELSTNLKPREAVFDSLAKDTVSTPEYSQFLKFKSAMVRNLPPNRIVRMQKDFDLFLSPKRRILGNPSPKKLLSNLYETAPWEIDEETQSIVLEV